MSARALPIGVVFEPDPGRGRRTITVLIDPWRDDRRPSSVRFASVWHLPDRRRLRRGVLHRYVALCARWPHREGDLTEWIESPVFHSRRAAYRYLFLFLAACCGLRWL